MCSNRLTDIRLHRPIAVWIHVYVRFYEHVRMFLLADEHFINLDAFTSFHWYDLRVKTND